MPQQPESPWGWLLGQLWHIMTDPAETPRRRRIATQAWADATRGSGAPAISVGSGFVAPSIHHSGHNLWLHNTISDWDGS